MISHGHSGLLMSVHSWAKKLITTSVWVINSESNEKVGLISNNRDRHRSETMGI